MKILLRWGVEINHPVVIKSQDIEKVRTILRWNLNNRHPAAAESGEEGEILNDPSDDPNTPRLTAVHLSQKTNWNVEMLQFLLLSGADIRTGPRNLESPLEFVLNLKCDENVRDEGKDRGVIHLLYAAGATIRKKIAQDKEGYRHVILRVIQEDQEPLLALTGLCRRQIRTHLLNPAGGNHNNLLTAVPRLPLPKPMREFLLFNLGSVCFESEDIMHSSL